MHDLTEVDEFTTPISVPDGTDSRNNAADVVEAIAQALANRTLLLATHAAFHDSPNTFTGGPSSFADVLQILTGIEALNPNAGEAALVQTVSADDDPNPANKWKSVIEAAVGGAVATVSMWSGIAVSDGQLLFTINAYWDASTQQWNQSTNTMHSLALTMSHLGEFTFSRVNSGSGPWASWPVTGDTVLRVGDVAAGDDVTAGGDITATGNVAADADVIAGGDFEFATPRTEYRAINLASGVGRGDASFNDAMWVFGVAVSQGTAWWPIVERQGTVLKQMRFIVNNPSGTDDATYNINLVRMHGQSFGSSTPPTYQTVDGEIGSVVAGETKTVTLDWGDLTVDVNEWYLVYMAGEALPADTDHRLLAMQLQATRLGPSQ